MRFAIFPTPGAAPVPQKPPGGEGPYDIKYIALIAERHSGSTWMVDFLKNYFRHKEVPVTAILCTWKVWNVTSLDDVDMRCA